MNDARNAQPPPAADLSALALTQGEAAALLDRIRRRSTRPRVPAGFLGLSARRTRQVALLAATVALADVALIACLPRQEPLQRALGATLVEGRPLTPRDVYLLHLWGKP
jgi:hypothetical protein